MRFDYVPKQFPMRIQPSSLWIAYDATDITGLNKLLPSGLRMSCIRILNSDLCPRPKLLFNAYQVDAPFMSGYRLEVLTIAEDKYRMPHFVILDCLSDTFQWDPLNGVIPQNARMSTRFNSNHFKHCTRGRGRRYPSRFEVSGTPRGPSKILRRFAVESNFECYYRNHSVPIALEFDEKSVLEDVQLISPSKVVNTLWTPYRGVMTHCFVHVQPMLFEVTM